MATVTKDILDTADMLIRTSKLPLKSPGLYDEATEVKHIKSLSDLINANGLMPDEVERLSIFVEEMSEVSQELNKLIQTTMKILRHGYKVIDPHTLIEYNNRQALETELGHLSNAITLMQRNNDISAEHIEQAAEAKRQTIVKYLHHQDPTKL